MFTPNSRYAQAETYTVTLPDGRVVSAVKIPRPRTPAPRGYHRRQAGERLDLIAYKYLNDATMSWRLCDANNALVPDALAARDLIGVPERDV